MPRQIPIKHYFSEPWLNETFPRDSLKPWIVLDHAKKNANQSIKDEGKFIENVKPLIKNIEKDRGDKESQNQWYC